MDKAKIKHIVENKASIIATKKAQMKKADGFGMVAGSGSSVSKASNTGKEDLQVTAIINTTNIMDSHKDVHLPGIWNKSLKENKRILHLQEHQMKFDKIIADGQDLKASAKTYTWKELGFDYEGETEALVFDSTVKADRNTFMFDQYSKGNVTNHSVGMQYVKLILCVNDDEYGAEKEMWDKYYPMIVNKESADQSGYFWAVKEAKVIEGSAVPIGSNPATPTQEVKEPEQSTHNEPPQGTQATITDFKNEFKNLFS